MSAENEFQMPSGVLVENKKLAIPRFYTEPMEMEHQSKVQGRPIFQERELVEIIIPGDRNTRVTEIVNDEHRARWPAEYAAFKKGEEAPLIGTPLKDWPPLTTARVRELAYFDILTVEQLAGVNDAQLQKLGMGAYAQREAAKKFLEVARDGTAPLMRLMDRADRAEEREALALRNLADANEEIARLREMLTHARV